MSDAPQLLEMLLERIRARPVSAFVDADTVLAGIDALCEPSRATRWQTRLWTPLRQRILARASRTIRLSAWSPAPVRARIEALLAEPVRIPRSTIERIVASREVRETMRTMLGDALARFFSSEGNAKGGVLKGALGLGMRAMGAAGKTLFGGLSDELQRRIARFLDDSMAALQERLATHLASEETARALGQQRNAAFVRLMETSEFDAASRMRGAAFAEIDPMVPPVVAHNLARAEFRDALKAEIAAILLELSQQPLGALLDDLGLSEIVRAAFLRAGTPIAEELLASNSLKRI